MPISRLLVTFALVGLSLIGIADARAQPSKNEAVRVGVPNGAAMVRALGPRAAAALAPVSGQIGALVEIPPGTAARDLGLVEVSPGIARLRGSAAEILAFADAHPTVHLEVAPPLHTLLDKVGVWTHAALARAAGAEGTGVLIGVADTGLDVTHPDLRDENGKSRIAWILDLSLAPFGQFPDLEAKFGIRDASGKLAAGAILSGAQIDALIASSSPVPTDEVGHGTHVTTIAAGSGANKSPYAGMAPKATIVFVRVTRDRTDSIENDDLVRAIQFLFDRADAMQKPMVANLSLGSDFGPHDGSFLWEQTIASYVGPDHPGRAIIAAAGNSGSIVETPIHESVRATRGATMKVPIRTGGAASGSVQVWVTLRSGADLKIGLDGPDGTWISPVAEGQQSGKNTAQYNAGVIYGSSVPGSPIPGGSRGAVVVWTGAWPSGTYDVTLEGEGMADLYLQGLGDAALGGLRGAAFVSGVREGTINLPATHPAIIGVGCTINRPNWVSIDKAELALRVPLLDSQGGLPDPTRGSRDIADGEVCWFSSAGPTVTGAQKPEISAPGGFVVAAMSKQAIPGNPYSVFTNSSCPASKTSGGSDPRCLQIDATHAVAVGTSMSAPAVAGVVALLFERDPTLTQDKILALLQAGAHPFRGASPFQDQGGPGELDATGALDALEQMHNPALVLPSRATSWLTLSSDYVAADGSTPITAILELRTSDGAHRADGFDPSRLESILRLDGSSIPAPAWVRRGPGLWFFDYKPARGNGGSVLTFAANFDGAPIAASKTLAVATDSWSASYPTTAKGGCNVSRRAGERPGGLLGLFAAAVLGLVARSVRNRLTRSRV